MPKVFFVNESVEIDVAPGESVRDAAEETGVGLDVARFRGGWSCGGRGFCRACVCWIEESAPGAAGPRSWMERLRGFRGWRRLACRATVIGDLKVFSMPAAEDRVGKPRFIAQPPSPVHDPNAPRKPDDAASTAAHVHGHPSAVGRGSESPKEIPPDAPSRPNAARPMPTAPPPPPGDDDG